MNCLLRLMSTVVVGKVDEPPPEVNEYCSVGKVDDSPPEVNEYYCGR